MRARHAMIAAILVGVLAAAVPPAGAQPTPRPKRQQQVIVPGERVGRLTVKMTPRQIVEEIGPGWDRIVYSRANPQEMKKACVTDELVVREWRDEGIWFSANPDESRLRVLGVFGATPDYVTDKGIELLDSIDDALRAYGDGAEKLEFPGCETQVLAYRYNAKGIQFEAAVKPGSPAHRRIFRIGVFVPGFFKTP